MTQGPAPGPLEQALINAGFPGGEAGIVATAFPNEPILEFLSGLEQIAQALADQAKPQLVPPGAEPWRTIHGHMLSNGTHPEDAYEAALSLWPAPIQMAIEAVVSLKLGDLLKGKQQSGGSGKRKFKTAEYISALRSLGYSFRMNDVNDTVEVNGCPLTDALAAEIRSRMRDIGFDFVNVMEDAYLAEAHRNRYHPVKQYLSSLQYDGSQHIQALAGHFTDKFGVFENWLRRWLIGAIAKAMRGEQNRVFILDGPQGIGKSLFVKWLGSGLEKYFCEASIALDDKDTYIRLMTMWIWEIAEFGQTFKRLDNEALKNFITLSQVTVRKPFGKYDLTKPALASMMGTVNNEMGILNDPTGNRRFMVTKVEQIDWNYSKLDVNQIWAEAYAAYLGGEHWNLSSDERKLANEINAQYEIEDPTEGLLLKYFKVDPLNPLFWTSSQEIISMLESMGLKGTTKQNSMALAVTMKRLNCERKKKRNSQGQPVWGYMGVIAI